jgi:hypothetical protein
MKCASASRRCRRRLDAACARVIAVGDPSYRTIKGILAAGTELDGLTERAAPPQPPALMLHYLCWETIDLAPQASALNIHDRHC